MVNHRTADDRAAHLSAEDLAALRVSLDEQRLFRREQLRQVAAAARMVLADVEAALERMREGRYGFCPLCREPIPLNHLVVVPQARYCGRCLQARGAEG